MTTQRSARRKGLYTYPLRVGRQIGPWYYNRREGSDRALYPTHGSGVLGKQIISESGDLSPLGEWSSVAPWVMSIELKHEKKWTWKGFMASPETSVIAQYWKQCFFDAVFDNQIVKFPLLVFTKNYEGDDYAMFSWGLLPKECAVGLYKLGAIKRYIDYASMLDFYNLPLLQHISKVGILSLTKFLQCVRAEQLRSIFTERSKKTK